MRLASILIAMAASGHGLAPPRRAALAARGGASRGGRAASLVVRGGFAGRYLAETLSLGEYRKTREWQNDLTMWQGYGYMLVSAISFFKPIVARSFFGLVDASTPILPDAAISLFFVPVFSIGFFYVVAGRACNKPHTLASGLNRVPVVAVPVLWLAAKGLVDKGIALTVAAYDGGFGLLTLILVGLNGLDKGFGG